MELRRCKALPRAAEIVVVVVEVGVEMVEVLVVVVMVVADTAVIVEAALAFLYNDISELIALNVSAKLTICTRG